MVIGCGALGGLVNGVLAGGERYRITLPLVQGRDFELGIAGPILVGIFAALLAWATALSESSLKAQVGGCLLAGVGGASYITNRIRAQNYRQSTDTAVETANLATSLAEPFLVEKEQAAGQRATPPATEEETIDEERGTGQR